MAGSVAWALGRERVNDGACLWQGLWREHLAGKGLMAVACLWQGLWREHLAGKGLMTWLVCGRVCGVSTWRERVNGGGLSVAGSVAWALGGKGLMAVACLWQDLWRDGSSCSSLSVENSVGEWLQKLGLQHYEEGLLHNGWDDLEFLRCVRSVLLKRTPPRGI